jgi:hypothetical protein
LLQSFFSQAVLVDSGFNEKTQPQVPRRCRINCSGDNRQQSAEPQLHASLVRSSSTLTTSG